MIKLVIDNRETKLIELLEENDIIIEKRNCELGDIIYEYEEKPFIIIERKTLSDLSSSIKDGRYKEQKMRLINNYNNCKKIYLIENIGLFNLSEDILSSCKINSILRDNISILESKSLKDSYEIILKIRKNIEKYKDILINGCKNDCDYINSVKINKKDNLTKENIQILQLSVIPGISKNISKLILNEFGSLNNIFKELENEEEFILKVSNIKNNNRKLGKKLGKKLYDNLI
jgi:ERCC4-type nuclease